MLKSVGFVSASYVHSCS